MSKLKILIVYSEYTFIIFTRNLSYAIMLSINLNFEILINYLLYELFWSALNSP